MKKPIFLSLFLSLLLLGAPLAFYGQTNNPFQNDDDPLPARNNRANILQDLDLSRQQLNRIRQINQQFRPPVRESNQRLQAANRALDEAIYDGQASDSIIQARLRDAQTAHAEWIRNRTRLESEIARALNPNQLARFREFRQQNKQNNARNRQLSNQAAPVRRLNRIQRPVPTRRIPRRNNL